MKKKLLFLIWIFLNYSLFAQKKFNVACRDFTYEGKLSSDGRSLRELFEITLSSNHYPFKILERDKIDIIFSALQEEKNLHKDLANEFNKKLQLAAVDYLVDGNFEKVVGNDQFKLIINFIKISGDEITTRLPLLITFQKDALSNPKTLTNLFNSQIERFINGYFVNTDSILQSKKNVDFFIELEKRDIQIRNLDSSLNSVKNDASIKSQTINNLNYSINLLQNEVHSRNDTIKSLVNQVKSIKEKEDFGQQIKITPPEIEVIPLLDTFGNINVAISLLNKVPIEFRVNIRNKDQKRINCNCFTTGGNPKIYPQNPLGVIKSYNISNPQFPIDSVFEIYVEVEYWSIYMEEMRLASLSKTYMERFIIRRNQKFYNYLELKKAVN